MGPMTMFPGYSEGYIELLDGNMVRVRVTHSGRAVKDWILQHFPEEVQFGIDTEWRPSRRGERNAAAILQLAGSRACLIVQLMYLDCFPKELDDFLADENVKLAGVSVNGDCEKLWEYNFQCQGAVELTEHAADVLDNKGLKSAGLKRLCKEILGLHLNKDTNITRSNWDVPSLGLDQITYAANDAYAGYKLLVNLDRRKADKLRGDCVEYVKLVNESGVPAVSSDERKACKARGYWEERLRLLDGNPVRVRVAFTARAVKNWIRQHPAKEVQFGIDLEWCRKRNEEDCDVAILQLASSRGCLLVQLKYIDCIPGTLKDFLADDNVELAGVGVNGNFDKLWEYGSLRCQGEVELSKYAAKVLDNKDLKCARLARLCGKILGLSLEKDETISHSNWEALVLSRDQITYAANKAYVAYKLLVNLAEHDDSSYSSDGSSSFES